MKSSDKSFLCLSIETKLMTLRCTVEIEIKDNLKDTSDTVSAFKFPIQVLLIFAG